MGAREVASAFSRGALGTAEYWIRRGVSDELLATKLQSKYTFLSREDAQAIASIGREAADIGAGLVQSGFENPALVERAPLVGIEATTAPPGTKYQYRQLVSFEDPTTGTKRKLTIHVNSRGALSREAMIAAYQQAIRDLQRSKDSPAASRGEDEFEILPEFMTVVRLW